MMTTVALMKTRDPLSAATIVFTTTGTVDSHFFSDIKTLSSSTTCLPIPSHAILHGENEEDQPDPEWLKIKTSKMIDDFTDVNPGEKEFMKMWNHHVQHYTSVFIH